MAIEDAIARLARAVELQGDTAAVREIIRERDEARKQLAEAIRLRDMYSRWNDEKSEQLYRKCRYISSLKGVITRMKNQRKAFGEKR